MPMTDRQRVEIGLFPQIMLAVTFSSAGDREDPVYKTTIDRLVLASAEAVQDLPPRKQHAILRRIERTHRAAVMPYLSNKPGAETTGFKIGLIGFFVLQAILDADYLVLPQDTHFSKALDTVVEALTPDPGEEKLVASARKQAGKVLHTLQREGYFQGVPYAA